MFRKSCYACGSSSVNILKSQNGWKTMHQHCKCGKNQTKYVLAVKRSRAKARKGKTTPLKSSVTHEIGSTRGLFVFTILSALIAFLSLAFAPVELTYAAESEPEIIKVIDNPIVNTNETIYDKVNRYADKGNIPRASLHKIVKCESSYNPKAKNVSSVERSFGLSQINTMSHKVSQEEAEDPDYALSFLVKHWGERKSMWKICSRGT